VPRRSHGGGPLLAKSKSRPRRDLAMLRSQEGKLRGEKVCGGSAASHLRPGRHQEILPAKQPKLIKHPT
jgi:hypothetical protein